MNPPVIGAPVEFRFDLFLVCLSFVTSLVGSYVALRFAAGQSQQRDRSLAAAIALGGCGIWSMHFIGMAAYKVPLYVSYGLLYTVASLLIAVGITWAGFNVALRRPRHLPNLLAGGAVIGAGVVAMHYLGMFGMEMRAVFEWNWPIVGASVVIAVVAATAALWLAFNVRTEIQRVGASVVMGVAVCAMHYTGMTAATAICTAQGDRSATSIDGPYIPYLVFMLALLSLGISSAYLFIGASTAPAAGRRSAKA